MTANQAGYVLAMEYRLHTTREEALEELAASVRSYHDGE
jgi:hypothetical protein